MNRFDNGLYNKESYSTLTANTKDNNVYNIDTNKTRLIFFSIYDSFAKFNT